MSVCKIFGKITEKKVLEKTGCSDYTFLKVENNFGKKFNFYASISNGQCRGIYLGDEDFIEGKENYFLINYLNNSVLNISEKNFPESYIFGNPVLVNVSEISECKNANGIIFYFYIFLIIIIFLIFIIFLRKKF